MLALVAFNILAATNQLSLCSSSYPLFLVQGGMFLLTYLTA